MRNMRRDDDARSDSFESIRHGSRDSRRCGGFESTASGLRRHAPCRVSRAAGAWRALLSSFAILGLGGALSVAQAAGPAAQPEAQQAAAAPLGAQAGVRQEAPVTALPTGTPPGSSTGSTSSATQSAGRSSGAASVNAASAAPAPLPGATAQPPLAEPVAPSLGAVRAGRDTMSTTADNGTLTNGVRRQVFTFEQLGALDPLQLHGVDSQNGVPFSVRADEVVTAATLHLIYSYSPSLLTNLSHLKVLVNGEVAATLPLPREQAGMLVARDIPLDPRLITEFNNLNVQLIAHYTQGCEDPASSALWGTVSNASTLDLTFSPLATPPDLGLLPLPFFDRRDIRRLELPFVFAAKPNAQTLEAAGIVASWFGSLARYRGALFPAQIDNPPQSGNAVVFATSDEHPAGVTLPTIDGPMLAIVERAAPARGKLLLVLGRDTRELKIAATALALGETALAGAVQTITHIDAPRAREPYDAPAWLPTDRPVSFGELTQPGELSVSGYNPDVIRVNLRVAPDLFTWRSKGIPIDLRYRFTARPAPDRSTLNINVDNTFVQSLRIPAQPSSMLDLGRYLNRLLPDHTAPAEREIYIPSHLLTSQAQLRFHFYYDMPKTGECQGQVIDNVRGEIDPNSTIDLSSFPHFMALPNLAAFANSGFPFTRLADLSETAVILPAQPGLADVSLYLMVMGRMGASTGYPVTGVTVGAPDDISRFADKDLLILGAPAQQPLLTTWEKSMPFSSDKDARRWQLSNASFRIADWWYGNRGGVRTAGRADLSLVNASGDAILTGFASPLRNGRSVVALIAAPGQSDADLMSALLDPDLVSQIQGGLTVVRGRALEVVSNGDVYYVGRLSPIQYLHWALSEHPLLLLFGGVIAALIIAALFYRLLRAIAARRLLD
ncbi:cellulose biosynthesis cyclic di-GMP-binding regulatory protein BcsB [Paraburkholderia humisilvae]|uniref:Cyclic di-GMP-binding protein n=1 Tax=Paraburkholderia humisilvae TaxID=627669 RepID=A0A6J5DCL2_9BURK|nr:cellulose biosynthesis cyclic di-GMP-binding regulatory protein BcsB [Paraburkholderia humisilvae]CAB3751980.1 Cyclic di-GMP-binding protein [Paraburkholderia humisilvae]